MAIPKKKPFSMEIELDEEYMRKLFKLCDKMKGNIALNDLIEDCIKKGIDNYLLGE